MLESVAAIFAPTRPDFPRPVTTTWPFVSEIDSIINSSAGLRLASSYFAKLVSAEISVSSALVAAAIALVKSAIDHPINS